MAHVFGQRHKKQNKAWHLTKLILSFYYQKNKKQKTKKQNKTYQKKKQNKRRRKKGKKKTKKQRRKRKGLRPPVSCDGNSGYLVSISTSIFGLSFFFFFLLPTDFLFPAETHQYSANMIQISPVQRESVKERKKKNLRRGTDTRAAASDSGAAPSQPRQCFLGETLVEDPLAA